MTHGSKATRYLLPQQCHVRWSASCCAPLAVALVCVTGCGGPSLTALQIISEALDATPDETSQAPWGFVYIAPGTFTMGGPTGEKGHRADEPQHEVTLTRGFYLQTTELTQGEWERVMGNNPSRFENCGSECPVEEVSWLDAIGYANARSRSEGFPECYEINGDVVGGGSVYDCTGYRLPTEAEWEYAARAGTITATYAGDMVMVNLLNAPILADIAWYAGNSGVSYESYTGCARPEVRAVPTDVLCGTHVVASQGANAWGLYDMLGNVAEWTHDWYAPYTGAATDPAGGPAGSERVYRGGSWDSDPRGVRAAFRSSFEPTFDTGRIGFRLARSY